MKIFFLCILNTVLMATGQILFKLGVNGKEVNNFYLLLKLFFNPIIILALLLYICTTALWLYILNKSQISFVYPIQALAYPLVLFASFFIFHEQISLSKWLGVFIICIGVFVLTR